MSDWISKACMDGNHSKCFSRRCICDACGHNNPVPQPADAKPYIAKEPTVSRLLRHHPIYSFTPNRDKGWAMQKTDPRIKLANHSRVCHSGSPDSQCQLCGRLRKEITDLGDAA